MSAASGEGTSAWEVYKRLLGHARPYRWLLLAALVGMLLEAGAGAEFNYLMKPVINETFISKNPNLGVLLPLAIVGLFVLRGLAGYVTDLCMGKSARSIARDFRVSVLGKYLRLPGARFDSEPVPAMLVRLGSDADQVAQAAVDAMQTMLQYSLQTIAALGMMLYVSWRVTLVVVLLGPPLGWMMSTVARRYRKVSHRIQESGAELLQAADEALSNQQEVKIYGAQAIEQARYKKLADRNVYLTMKVQSTKGISSAVVQIMGAVGLALLLFFAGREAMAGRLDAGGFVSLMLSMVAIIPALRNLAGVQNVLQRGVASAQRIFAVLDTADETDAGGLSLRRAHGQLEFRHVSARYPGTARNALEDVSFIARPGTVTAIVGRSGSGKSTLVKLIPRFYDFSDGEILLDDAPLRDYRLADLRRQIALVGQQVMLFNGSIAQNVAYGELRDAPPEALEKVVHGANAMEFVKQLPEKLDAPIGNKGGRLSGGQRQRLAIARAMLKDAPILILDEATAALDNESERLVQDALQHLMPDRTTLVIAHRLSTIEHADQVLVLDQGRLVERGTHAELLARDGLYAHLYKMQFREAE